MGKFKVAPNLNSRINNINYLRYKIDCTNRPSKFTGLLCKPLPKMNPVDIHIYRIERIFEKFIECSLDGLISDTDQSENSYDFNYHFRNVIN